MDSSPQTLFETGDSKTANRNEKSRCFDRISSAWGEEIARTYFWGRSERVAKLARTIVLQHHTWAEVSNILNIRICNRVLKAHRSGRPAADKEVKVKPKDLEKFPTAKNSEATESIKETSDKLISDLSLLGVKVKIGKYGIVEPDNEELAFSTHPPTFRSKNQGSDSLAPSLEFVPPKPKSGDTTDSASLSTHRSGTFPSQYQGFPSTLTRPISPASLLQQEATESDTSNQYKAPTQHEDTEPYQSPQYEAAEPNPLPKHEAAESDFSLQQKIVEPDHSPQQEATKPGRSSQHDFSYQHEVAEPVFLTLAEPDPSLQHMVTGLNPLLEHEAAIPNPSEPEKAIQPDNSLQHRQTEPESSIQYKASAQHEATEPNHSLQQKATNPDHSLPHEVATPDSIYPLHEYEAVASEPAHSLQHKAAPSDISRRCEEADSPEHEITEPKYEELDISTKSSVVPPKKRILIWLVETSTNSKRSSVFCHTSHCDSGKPDCSCCTTLDDLNTSWHERLQSSDQPSLLEGLCLLSALRYRRGHTDLCELHFNALVTKLGLNCNGPRNFLIERLDAIWKARDSWDKLSSLKSTYPSWFTDAEYSAQDYKVKTDKCISTATVVSDYGEEDSDKITTSIAWPTCNDEGGINDMKIFDAMTKFGDEKVSQVAHLDKGQISDFRNLFIAGDEIAKSIGELRLLHPETHGKISKISHVHEHHRQSPHGFKVVLDLHNLLPFCKDGWLTAQGINGTLAELAKPLDPAIQILSAEVGYLICSKADGSDKRPIQDHDIPNINSGTVDADGESVSIL